MLGKCLSLLKGYGLNCPETPGGAIVAQVEWMANKLNALTGIPIDLTQR
jgi:hypothetical protein